MGRALVSEILPKGLPFDLINQDLRKGDLEPYQHLLPHAGLKQTVVFADQLMYMGFRYATRSGVSIGVDDMLVPEEKPRS